MFFRIWINTLTMFVGLIYLTLLFEKLLILREINQIVRIYALAMKLDSLCICLYYSRLWLPRLCLLIRSTSYIHVGIQTQFYFHRPCRRTPASNF
ncbi:MAG: hypothetical protein ACI9ZT_001914 [Gammaproteobacteria bacterium]|jgi:hypothetical protein